MVGGRRRKVYGIPAGAAAIGAWESPGYLPPCSGGIGNRYFAVIKAVDANKTVLAETEITLGRY